MIVSKSSSGKGFVALVAMDLFSKVFQAFPLASQDTDSVKEALNHFVGAKAKNPQTICKSDCAKEFVESYSLPRLAFRCISTKEMASQ